MKNKWLIYGAVAVGAYLIYKRMNKGNGKELAPPPVSTTRPPSTFGKPPINTSPAKGKAEGLPSGYVCPSKEQMARTRYSEAQMEQLKSYGCLNN
jgi:hypothetical protein